MNQNIIDQQSEIIHNFRRCHMKGCLAEGWWSPVISLSPDGLQSAFIPFDHIIVCDHHKNNIGLDDFINGPLSSGEGSWEHIQGAFARAGKMVPQIEFSALIWRES